MFFLEILNLRILLDNNFKIKTEPEHEENLLINQVVGVGKPNILKKKTHVITTQTSIEEIPEIKKSEELLDERIVSREGDIYTCLLCISNNEISAGEAKAIILHMRQVSI